jgi:iron complex outermembrane receptor protein
MAKFAPTATMRGNRHFHGVSALALTLGLMLPATAFAADKAPADPAPAEQAAQTPAPDASAADQTQDIVVTGFRRSLDAALSVKRDSVSAVDAIVAEDIAKFPDQNLAESLQRIPGISIQRDGGEGRAITVRGLGAQFTRVRVNGLETVATSSDGASSNRDRAFDFNVFASELFSSLVVHKTAEPSLDEGSLGAVVDLNTGNPLAGKAGFTGVLSLQGSYNDLSKNVGPRAAGLISWRNDAGTFGVNFSGAYSKTNTLELGNNSVRWAQAYFNSVNGTNCFYSVPDATGGTPVNFSGKNYRPSAACDAASLSFHPRIPRYGIVRHDRERLGLTGSIQFAPSAGTKISIDALYSRFKETREEKWLEVLARSNEKGIDVVNPAYDSSGNMISATFNNAYVRTEHYLRQSTTEFYQVGGKWDQDLTDKLRFTLLGGLSKSAADIPVETTILFDNRNAAGFKYDYSNMASPTLSYGIDVNNPANFQLAEIRDRPSSVVNRFKTAQLRTEYDVVDGFQIKAGGVWRRFNFDAKAYLRDTAVCGSSGADLVLGTLTCSSTVYGFPVTSALADSVNLGSAGQPSGTTSQFVVADLPATTAFTKLYSRTATPDVGNIRSVQETTSGGYLEFDVKGELFGLKYAGNAGVRYAHTDQQSTGILSGVSVTVKRTYDDWLPSFNIALYPTHDIIIRGAIAKVMTRPTLGNLTPGGSIDGFNYKISYGNPYLEPYRATNFDLGVEWYFAPQSVLSVALFQKNVNSFPKVDSYTSTLAGAGLTRDVLPPSSPAYIANDASQIYTVSANVNGTGAKLQGVEIALQLPFSFLPGILKHTGIQANATFIKSTATYRITGPAISACTRTAPTAACTLTGVPADYTSTLLGVSKRAANATLYYDDEIFSVRGSVSYRGPFVDSTSGTGNVFEGYGSYTSFDASLRYKVNKHIELSVDGNNLTDAYRYRFTDVTAERNYENNHFGRTILFGARVKI